VTDAGSAGAGVVAPGPKWSSREMETWDKADDNGGQGP
jgi:hypothetical protein